jgi:hypothetical protein
MLGCSEWINANCRTIGKSGHRAMARDHKRKALYEVIGRTGYKSGHSGDLERLHPKTPDTTSTAQTGSLEPAGETAFRWRNRPRLVQFNAGRLEFSLPYQVAIAAALGLVLALLVSFRLGQYAGSGRPRGENAVVPKAAGPAAAVESPAKPTASDEPAGSKGNNRIVIQTYQVRAHLEPVKQYFDNLGVQTEIIGKDGWYYLVTKNKFDNPDKPGTDGYAARQKIIDLGAKYKAPEGYESFAPRLFKDAYGMRID